MQTEFQFNRDGFNVKRQALKPITDAATRFAALLVEQPAPIGFAQPCQVFQGENFNDGERIVKPRRFALRLRGIEPPLGARFTVLCKTPGCVRHVEVKSE